MAAGKHGPSEVTITYDDGPGGTGRDVTQHIRTINGLEIEQITERSDAFGDSSEEALPIGKQRVPDIVLGGAFDDTATTGPHTVFGSPDSDPQGLTRTLVVVVGNSKTFTMETRLAKYKTTPNRDNLTSFEATIRQAGAAAWS